MKIEDIGTSSGTAYLNTDVQHLNSTQNREITISSKGVKRFLFSIIGFLALLHLIAVTMLYSAWGEMKFWIHFNMWFNLDMENNLPTLFSFLILIISSLLLFFIFSTTKFSGQKNFKFNWLLLSMIFLFLSFDEALSLHEEITGFIGHYFKNRFNGLLRMAWVIPYGILSVIIGFLFLKFFFSLPKKTQQWFFISGALFIFGALISELIEGYAKQHGMFLLLQSIKFLQEICEMSGITLFIGALISYISPSSRRLIMKSSV